MYTYVWKHVHVLSLWGQHENENTSVAKPEGSNSPVCEYSHAATGDAHINRTVFPAATL